MNDKQIQLCLGRANITESWKQSQEPHKQVHYEVTQTKLTVIKVTWDNNNKKYIDKKWDDFIVWKTLLVSGWYSAWKKLYLSWILEGAGALQRHKVKKGPCE